MITIATLLRGNNKFTMRLFDDISKAYPDKLKIIAACNNDDDKIIAEQHKATVIPVKKYTGNSELQRINFVSSLWKIVLGDVKTDYVALWDDDIIPQQNNSIKLLFDSFRDNAAGVVSVYPFKSSSRFAVLYNFTSPESIRYNAIPIESIPEEVFEISGGGMGLSIWKTEVLKSTLPWLVKSNPVGGAPMGFDYNVALNLRDNSIITLCNGAVKCNHVND